MNLHQCFLKLFLLTSLLFGVFSVSIGQRLSNKARLTILSAAPGEDLYAAFGHSAFRIQDSIYDIDVTFNYGIFDFDTPNFYMKFTRGKLNYKLGISSYKQFMGPYKREGRQVVEIPINLTYEEIVAIFRFLENNYKPENRYYLYDFFYDNCATKLIDVLIAVLGPEPFQPLEQSGKISFRNLIDPYIQHIPWTDLGIDLLMGLPTDKVATYKEQMFLPDLLARNLKLFPFKNKRGEPLIGEEIVVLEGKTKNEINNQILTPFNCFLLLSILILLVSRFFGDLVFLRYLDTFLLFFFGFIGLFITFMWWGTDHVTTKMNLNIIWANPVYFLLPFVLKYLSFPLKRIIYILILASSLFFLITYPFLPQGFNPAIIPLILILVIRMVDRITERDKVMR